MLQTKTFDVSVPPGTIQIELLLASTADQYSASHETLTLFLPFWGGSSATYTQVLSDLESKHPEAIFAALSYSGTGRTSVPPDDSAYLHSITPKAEQVLAVLNSKDLAEVLRGRPSIQSGGLSSMTSTTRRLILVGHSMSAKIAYVLLSKLEKDLHGFTATDLILLGPAPIRQLILPPEIAEQQPRVYDTIESATWAIENILSESSLEDDIVRRLAQDCVGMSPGAKAGWIDFGMQFDCAEYVSSVRRMWPDLNVQVVMGEKDKVETVESVRNGTIDPLRAVGFEVREHIADGSGHLLPIEASEKVVEVVSRALDPGTRRN